MYAHISDLYFFFDMTTNILQFDYKDDGVTHINIYSKGRTNLGRMLSHFYPVNIKHPYFGEFDNMECFWQYLSTGCKHEELRKLSGFEAKKASKSLEKVFRSDFMEQIKFANTLKLVQHKCILDVFLQSTLPFEHYYTFGEPAKVVRPKEAQDLIDMFNDIKKELIRDSHGK